MTASEAEAHDQIAFSRLQILQRFIHFREYFVIDNRPEDAVTEAEVIPGFFVPVRIIESCAIEQDNLSVFAHVGIVFLQRVEDHVSHPFVRADATRAILVVLTLVDLLVYHSSTLLGQMSFLEIDEAC